MLSKTVETRARTTKDGRLNLSVDVDVADADADVDVVVTVTPVMTVPSTGTVGQSGSSTAWPVRCRICAAGRKVNSKSGFRSNDLSSGHQRLHFAAPSETAPADRPVAIAFTRRATRIQDRQRMPGALEATRRQRPRSAG